MPPKKQILLVGSYPPPYGGCSVHIQRLQKSLAESFDIKVIDLYSKTLPQDDVVGVFRCGTRQPFNMVKAVFLLTRLKADIVHFHVSAMGNFMLAGFVFLSALQKGTRKVISIHSGSFVKNYANLVFFKKSLLIYLLRKFDQVITVNSDQKNLIESLGVQKEIITVAPAFLPPISRATERVSRVVENLRKRTKHIIISSGYALPYYGFHLILDALDSDAGCKNLFGVIFCFYNTYDNEYVASLKARLDDRFDHAIFEDLTPEEFSYVLSQSDIYVRATDRDGDAVAIREAAFYGKKIVASDCVERPSGAILFNIEDVPSLKNALMKSAQEKDSGEVTFDYYENLKKIAHVYEDLLIIGAKNETNIAKS